ncbi:MAG TPA: hypothetical protein VFN52_03310, partial [Acidiferrobacteraceae bacterium]|nr:hypothetical protein [Acidiferrobacteraceae bacterium]
MRPRPHPMTPNPCVIAYDRIRALEWRDGHLRLLDQRRLPRTVDYQVLGTLDAVAQAIRDMVVRGAPAIGIAAAYGAVLGAAEFGVGAAWDAALARLRQARPTAVNLGWAIDRMRRCAA